MDGRTLGGNELLIPFTYAWLGENSYRQLLAHVLAEHYHRPEFLATVEELKLMCKKHQETNLNLLDTRKLSSAQPCMDISVSAAIV